MTRLNLSEVAKERLEKSYLRYEYEDNTGIGKLVSTCPNYKGEEYIVCRHTKFSARKLENKIENEFPQFISSVNVFRNLMGNENFKNYGQSYNFETGIIKLVEYDNMRSGIVGVGTELRLNCGEVSIGDNELNVNVAIKKQTKGTYNVSNLYSDISEDVALNNEYFKVEKNVEKKLNTDNFNIENCNNYKQMYNINMVRSSTLVASEGFEKWGSMNKTERYQYTIDKNNYIPVDIIKTTEVATYSTKLPIKGLLHTNTNFLNNSIDYFNKNGKSKEFLILFDKDNKNVSETDIKQMLLDEDVLDANLYKEFQDHYKAENTSLLEPSEYAFINAINEVNERAQNRNDQGLIR